MPTLEAGYTYAVVPCLPEQIACNEEESIFGPQRQDYVWVAATDSTLRVCFSDR